MTPKTPWTNASVLRFAKGADPVAAVIERARQVVLGATDRGWTGPPFDPLRLAELLKLDVARREDVRDARTLATAGGRLRIPAIWPTVTDFDWVLLTPCGDR